MKIRAFGVFKELFGSKMLTITLKKKVTVKDLVQRLADSLLDNFERSPIYFEISDLWSNALILVNGKEISVLNGLETLVSDEDEIVLLPVSHGG